jgi:hypothetical protein
MRVLVVLLLVSLALVILQSVVPGSALGMSRHDTTLGLAATITFLAALVYGIVQSRSLLAAGLAVAGVGCVLFAVLVITTGGQRGTGPSGNEVMLAAGVALLILSVTVSMHALMGRQASAPHGVSDEVPG